MGNVPPPPVPGNLNFVPPSPPSSGDVVPVIVRWNQGGQRVSVTGSFSNWGDGLPMVRSGQEFFQVLSLSRGVHQIKFIVDDEWRCSADLPTVEQTGGGVNNFVDLRDYKKYKPNEMVDPLDGPGEFTQEIVEAPNSEPPTIPILLLKSPLVATPVASDLPLGSAALEPFLVNDRSKPLIPAHATCMHIYNDGGETFKSKGATTGSVLWVTSMRYRTKVSLNVFINQSKSGINFLKTLLKRSPIISAAIPHQ